VADKKHLFVMTFIADIAPEAENDRRKTRSGSGGDDQTDSPILNKDLKLQEVGKVIFHTKGQGGEE
jgi:hypothetical protein